MVRLIEFIIIFIFCYLIYLFGVILRKKKNKFIEKEMRVEETYLISKYNLDMKKINYKKHLHITSLCNSLIFSITLQVVTLIDGMIWQILFSIVVIVPQIVFIYHLIGKYYIKKGYTKKAKIIDNSKNTNSKNFKKEKISIKERSDKNV